MDSGEPPNVYEAGSGAREAEAVLARELADVKAAQLDTEEKRLARAEAELKERHAFAQAPGTRAFQELLAGVEALGPLARRYYDLSRAVNGNATALDRAAIEANVTPIHRAAREAIGLTAHHHGHGSATFFSNALLSAGVLLERRWSGLPTFEAQGKGQG